MIWQIFTPLLLPTTRHVDHLHTLTTAMLTKGQQKKSKKPFIQNVSHMEKIGAELSGYFSWTLHKTRGCWLRSFISSQPLQAEAGHSLSLTYVLYKPRQCPTNAGFYSRKSLSITAELFAFLSPMGMNRPWLPDKCRPASRGDNSVGKKRKRRKPNTNRVYTMGSASQAICLVR